VGADERGNVHRAVARSRGLARVRNRQARDAVLGHLDDGAGLPALFHNFVRTDRELDDTVAVFPDVQLPVVCRAVADEVEGEGRRTRDAVVTDWRVEGDRANALAVDLGDFDKAGSRKLFARVRNNEGNRCASANLDSRRGLGALFNDFVGASGQLDRAKADVANRQLRVLGGAITDEVEGEGARTGVAVVANLGVEGRLGHAGAVVLEDVDNASLVGRDDRDVDREGRVVVIRANRERGARALEALDRANGGLVVAGNQRRNGHNTARRNRAVELFAVRAGDNKGRANRDAPVSANDREGDVRSIVHDRLFDRLAGIAYTVTVLVFLIRVRDRDAVVDFVI